MTIEIICHGCEDCLIVRGKICQALSDLNLNADVISIYEPFQTAGTCLSTQPELRIDGQPIVTDKRCTVKDFKDLFDERTLPAGE